MNPKKGFPSVHISKCYVKFLWPLGTEGVVVHVSSVLWWGPPPAWQCLSLLCGERGIFSSCPQILNEPYCVFELSGSYQIFSIPWQIKILYVLHWLWSGTGGKETGQPHECCVITQGSIQRLQRAWSRCCHGLMCCLCTALRSLPALMSRGFRWKSQSHRGDIMAPLSEVHWHWCAASLWQSCKIWQLPCKGQQPKTWEKHWTHPAAPGWHPGLGWNSLVD